MTESIIVFILAVGLLIGGGYILIYFDEILEWVRRRFR